MTDSGTPSVRQRTFWLTRGSGWRSGWVVATLLPALILAWVALRSPPPVMALRDLIFDSYLRVKPRAYDPSLPVRVVDVDEASLAQYGQWPWPRSLLAQLTRKLLDAGASAIAFDILMAEPDRYSLAQIASGMPEGNQRQALEALARSSTAADNDGLFAQTIAGESVVMAMVGTHGVKTPPPLKAGFAAAGDRPHDFLPSMEGAILPLPGFHDHAAGLASLNFFPDRDLVVRRVPTLITIAGTPSPGLALEALRVAQQATTFITKASNASGETAFGAQT
ncbi:MAG: CHASE2 domain-containing protein, partial [Beijerinckiaceae bacterium]